MQKRSEHNSGLQHTMHLLRLHKARRAAQLAVVLEHTQLGRCFLKRDVAEEAAKTVTVDLLASHQHHIVRHFAVAHIAHYRRKLHIVVIL